MSVSRGRSLGSHTKNQRRAARRRPIIESDRPLGRDQGEAGCPRLDDKILDIESPDFGSNVRFRVACIERHLPHDSSDRDLELFAVVPSSNRTS